MSKKALRTIESAMAAAETYEEWREAARAYDERSGLQRWKRKDQSPDFDYVSIRHRLDRLRSLRARHDYPGLLFTLNEGIHGLSLIHISEPTRPFTLSRMPASA